jgi:hypothetical protein
MTGGSFPLGAPMRGMAAPDRDNIPVFSAASIF